MEPKLYVDAGGEGPDVVLAHGLGGSARNWRPQLRALRPRYRATAYDARGHARSEAPSGAGAYALDALVDDLARIAPEGAVLCGLSLGALTALHLTLREPARVRALALASWPAPRASGGFADVALPFADAIEREGLDAAGARFVWGERSGLDPAGARLVRQGFLEHAPHAIAGVLRECIAEQPGLEALAPRLRALDVPVLLVAGEKDSASLEASRGIADALPRARLAVVPDAGHVVNLAQPKAFDALLLGLLDRTL